MDNLKEIDDILSLTAFVIEGKSYPIVHEVPVDEASTKNDTIYLYKDLNCGRGMWKASLKFSILGGHLYAGKTIEGVGEGSREEINEKLSALHDLEFWASKW